MTLLPEGRDSIIFFFFYYLGLVFFELGPNQRNTNKKRKNARKKKEGNKKYSADMFLGRGNLIFDLGGVPF